ncbi:hypothetical protein D3C80_1750300 [compost metagenome]
MHNRGSLRRMLIGQQARWQVYRDDCCCGIDHIDQWLPVGIQCMLQAVAEEAINEDGYIRYAPAILLAKEMNGYGQVAEQLLVMKIIFGVLVVFQ